MKVVGVDSARLVVVVRVVVVMVIVVAMVVRIMVNGVVPDVAGAVVLAVTVTSV